MRKTQSNGVVKASTSPSSGARESNAGDDFHILWAARRAVPLLNPQKNLCRVRMEGVSPIDEVRPPEGEDYFLGVDLTEYYEGDNFVTATTVVASQLKYSTRHPTQSWTSSRLCAKKRRQMSVIRHLADIYQGFILQNPREEVLKKLHIRLVSNQPVADDLRAAVGAAQDILKNNETSSSPVQAASLIKQLSTQDQDIIRSLQKGAGLRSGEFTDFLRLLDFTGCGEEDRGFQRLRLIQELSPSVSSDPVAALRDLCDLIRREAQPEAAGSTGLSKHDVLASLGVRHEDSLFPAQSHLQPVRHAVETSEARELASIIVAAKSGRILAHGNAGVGKTTTIQMLSNYLPPGSVVVTYDCFGGGNYLVPGEQRHTQRRAFLQLTNELAVHSGTPFLIRPAHEAADLQRDFRRSLEMASKIVAAEPEGLLVIFVDAADDAIVAAHDGRDCFVPILWQFPLPSNCRLVMTCRSHRRTGLQAPQDVVEYELKGFDNAASATYLRQAFPNASDGHCRAFHLRTDGNPRMQFYLLDELETAGNDVTALDQLSLAPKRTPKQMFDDLLAAAVKHSTQPDKSQQYLATLLCLSRPIPVDIFATACTISLEEANNFCRALMPGLILENSEISFRDEDFETYLRGRLSSDDLTAAHGRLGAYFLERANQYDYAARAVAEHLISAGRYSEVINLALDGPEPSVVADEMLRLQIRRRRIGLAMQAASCLGCEDDAVRLLLLSAEAARSDGAVTALVRENPELAAHYGDTHSVARLYLREENSSWLGSAHLRTAAMYARDPAQQDRAKEHFQAAEAWLRRRMLLQDHERYGWRIDAIDIACGAEAIYWLYGPEQAKSWLKGWRPISIVLEAIGHLATSLTVRVDQEQLDRQLSELKLSPWAMAAFLAALWQAGREPACALVNRTAERLDRAVKGGRNPSEAVGAWSVAFCELAASSGIDVELIQRISQALGPELPGTLPYERDDLSRYDLPLRALGLRAALVDQELTTGTLLPEQYRKKEEQDKHRYDPHESERRRFNETIGKVLNIYKIRAQAILKRLAVMDVTEVITRDLESRRTESEHRWFKFDWQYAIWAKITCEALLNCSGDAEHLLEQIADLAERTIRGSAPGLWIDMAEKLARREAYRPLAYRLLERAARYIMEKPFPGQDRWQTLLRCAAAAGRHDERLCRDYYKRALAAAEGIDDDCTLLLSLQARLAQQVAPYLPSQERSNLATRLARIVEVHEDYVSGASSLPWEATLGAVTCLDPANGLALCSRWDDETRLQLHNGIIPIVRETTDSGFLSPLEGLWLLRLAGERYDVSKEALPLVERLRAAGIPARPQLVQASQAISEWIRRDVPLRQRKAAAARVVEWADRCGMTQLAGIAELRGLLAFVAQFPPEDGSGDTLPYRTDSVRETNVQELIKNARSGSIEDLEARLNALWRQAYDGQLVRDFLRTLSRAITPSQRVQYLDTLISLDSFGSLTDFIIEELRLCLTEWRDSLDIRNWTPGGISRLLEHCLPSIIAYEHNATENLQVILSLPNLASVSRTALVLPAIVKHMEILSPRALYAVAEVLAKSLPARKLRDVLDWSLARTESQIARDQGIRSTDPPAQLPNTPPAVLAHFFWALFGHPDKRVRWRALHAARAILHLPNKALLDELVRLSWSETTGAFRSERLVFYSMSACTWLFLLLLRLADERPEDMREHVQAIADHALNPTFPHAQIRELARQTALRVVKHLPQVLPLTTLEQLKWVNVPLACLYPRKAKYELERQVSTGQQKKKSRFDFDYLDTIRYWYPQVSDIFDCPTQNVVERAEDWICDRWGFADKDWWNDPRELSDRYTWQQMDHSQGGIPKVENLHTYLDYNAMFCAAGEMVDGLPIAASTYEDAWCPWEDWLKRHVSSNQEYWLADLRSPTPYRPDCWGQFPPIKEWLLRDDPAEYDSGLGLLEAEHADQIVILGHIAVGDIGRRGTIRVTSALVNPDTARSLLIALQTADPRDFRLPLKDYWPDDIEINEPGFELKAWLGHQHVEEGLDEFDPLARGVGSYFETFGGDFIGTMELGPVPARQEYALSNGDVAAWLEIWSDSLETERIAEPFSEGQRLWLRLDVLLDYLRRRERDLIIEVQIARNREYNQREKDEEYDLGKSTIYLLRRDGILETLDNCRKIGQANCS